MTARQYRKMCRVRANKIGKFISYCILMGFFYVADCMQLSGYVTAAVSLTLWFYIPDVVIYLLEKRYKIKHDHVSYR